MASDPTPTRVAPTRFANLALGLDAAYRNVIGLVFTLTGGFMANWLGIPGWIAVGFGLVTMGWALVVTLYANRRVARLHELNRVVTVNIVFLIGATLGVVLPGPLSTGGRQMLAIGSIPVVCVMVAQIVARNTLAPSEPTTEDSK